MISTTIQLPKHKQKVPYVLVKNQQALIMPIGDIHYGAKGFPEEKLKEHIEWGLDRGALFIGMGEYLDFTPYSQQMQMKPLRDNTRIFLDGVIRNVADDLVKILEPTKERWIGLLEGDHRWDFMDGQSVDQYICQQLRTYFLGTSALIRLMPTDNTVDSAATNIYVHHGIGAGRTQGGQLHRVEDLLKFIEADLYLMGHSHGKVSAPIDRLYISPDGVMHHRTKVIARTGGWLRGYVSHAPLSLEEPVIESRGSYVEQKAYVPSALGGLCIGVGYEQIRDSKYYRPAIHYSV